MTPRDHIVPVYVRPAEPSEFALAFAGTAFYSEAPQTLVTAAHVVAGYEAGAVFVDAPGDPVASPTLPRDRIPVESIARHETADVAVLRVQRIPNAPRPLIRSTHRIAMGSDIAMFGFPYQDISGRRKLLEPRVQRGYIQRFFDFEVTGRSYLAMETSFPISVGMSGAPIFAGALDAVAGVATTNFESRTIVDYDEEHRGPDHTVVQTTPWCTRSARSSPSASPQRSIR